MLHAKLRRAFPPLDFDSFHGQDLPRRLAAGNGAIAARGLGSGGGAIAFRVKGRGAYTYLVEDGRMVVVAGEERADTVVEFEHELWEEFVYEIRTAPGLLYDNKLVVPRGEANEVFRWEGVVRAMFDGREVYDPALTDLRDMGGRPLDLAKAFDFAHLDAEQDEASHFLTTAGFLVVRGVFGADEIARLNAAADRLAAHATPEDKLSWWARDRHGRRLLCRLNYTSTRCDVIRENDEDPRLDRLLELTDKDLHQLPDRLDGSVVILKHPEVVEGLADIPWHVDCGIGGHSLLCPTLVLSIFLERLSPESGALGIIAGSTPYAKQGIVSEEALDRFAVTPRAEPGDCVFHWSDTFHAGLSPTSTTGPFRRSLVRAFYPARVAELVGPGQAFNDIL
ncbi:MAG: phytanoyl-CoA dioxygenase family protein, partial [Deltaproteobacteria bacterium]